MLPAGPAVTAPAASTPEAEEFVRFCYDRRRVGWPELYDEMCAVASRGLFRGMGSDELAEIGIGFSLFETPRLAVMVQRLVMEEQARRSRARSAAMEAAAAAGLVERSVVAAAPEAVAPGVPAAEGTSSAAATPAAEGTSSAAATPAGQHVTASVALVEPARTFVVPRLALAASA